MLVNPVLERRTQLNEASQQPNKGGSRKRQTLALTAIFILTGFIILAGGLYVIWHHASKSPLPASVTQSVGFPVYYPSALPSGYVYQVGSAKNQSGLLFYKFINGNKAIAITEQAAPANPVKLSALPNYSKLNIAQGQAAVGTSLGSPSAIMVNSTTLVSLSSAHGVSRGDIITTIEKMAPLNNLSGN